MCTDDEVVSTNIESVQSSSVADFLASRSTFSCWDAVEKIGHCTLYNELRVAPEDNSVFLAESLVSQGTTRSCLTCAPCAWCSRQLGPTSPGDARRAESWNLAPRSTHL